MTMTPIERAEATMKHLGGNGKLSEKQAERFVEYVAQIARESRESFDALPWGARVWWRVKTRVRVLLGLDVVPYGFKVIEFKQPSAKLPREREKR